MDIERGRDAQDEAPKPAEGADKSSGGEGTAAGSPKRDDGTRAVEVEDLNSADDEGAN